MKIKNTLSGKVEEFVPNDYSHIKMYVCGPTVYDDPHIGNIRSLIVFDNLYRILKHVFGRVTYIRNITDVDDKIMKKARQLKVDIKDLTESVYERFKEYTKALNILPPTFEPKATESIDEIIAFIKDLIENGIAYFVKGHVLFDVKQDFYYGCLSKKCTSGLHPGARVEVKNYKRSPLDFVLWKPSTHNQVGWDSPWGFGRPGWHIECSAMCRKYFGGQFDIHGGGQDLIFPHHENEIAQNRYYRKDFKDPSCNYWIHNGLLLINGKKMSKSLKNVILVDDALKQYHPEVIRYFFTSMQYSKPCDWTDENLNSAKRSLDSLYNAITQSETQDEIGEVDKEFLEALMDDLNFPKALSRLHQIASEINKSTDASRKQQLAANLRKSGSLCGILAISCKEWFRGKYPGNINPAEIDEMLEKRNAARAKKDFKLADEIRACLQSNRIVVEDLPDGSSTWKKI